MIKLQLHGTDKDGGLLLCGFRLFFIHGLTMSPDLLFHYSIFSFIYTWGISSSINSSEHTLKPSRA